MLLPLGIINQLNAPTTYLTVDRPLTDLLIIPTFWRELGAGIFGEVGGAVRYQLDVVRGLDGAGFSAQAPLAGGRSNGFGGGTTGAAVTARLELFGASDGFVMGAQRLLRLGVGRTAGAGRRHRRRSSRATRGFAAAASSCAPSSPSSSSSIRTASTTTSGLLGQDAVPKAGRGGYVQVGYDVLRLGDVDTRQELLFFAAYENVNPRSAMSPYNYNPPTITGPARRRPNAPSPSRSFVRGGIDYRPLPELVFKVDLQIALDGEGPAPDGAGDGRGRARDAAPAHVTTGGGRARKVAARAGRRLRVLTITMRQFASSGFRLWNLGIEAKVLYTTFCVLTLFGIVSSALYYGDLVGAGTSGIKSYYAGEARAPRPRRPPRRRGRRRLGPPIDVPEDEAGHPPIVVPMTYRKLLEVTHFHLFTMPVVLLIIGHLFLARAWAIARSCSGSWARPAASPRTSRRRGSSVTPAAGSLFCTRSPGSR